MSYFLPSGNTLKREMKDLNYERYDKQPTNSKKQKNEKKKKSLANRLEDGKVRKFLMSFFSCFLILSCFVAAFIVFTLSHEAPVTNVDAGVSQKIPEPDVRRKADSKTFTMLICVKNSEGEPVELMLYRLDDENSRTVIMPISVITEIVSQGSRVSCASVFRENEMSKATETLSEDLGITIDYSCEIKNDNFIKIFDKLGGLYADVPKSFEYNLGVGEETVTLTQGREQYLSGNKIYALTASRDYGDEEKRLSEQQQLMKAFVTTKLNGLYMKDPSRYFGSIFNIISTRFSMNDLINKYQKIDELSAERNVETPFPSYDSKSANGLMQLSDTLVFEKYFR